MTRIPARIFAMMLFAAALSGCEIKTSPPESSPPLPPPSPSSDGKYYLDDGPPELEPESLDLSDAVPRFEPINPKRNRPYTVFGQTFSPMRELAPYRERGFASWYGRRYHGNATASGEIYDMFQMTAAHRTLPLPSYARVTRADDGRSAIVRINDRGPFLYGRLIDLSYAAAKKLGVVESGTAEIIVESILPDGDSSPPLPSSEKDESSAITIESEIPDGDSSPPPPSSEKDESSAIAIESEIPDGDSSPPPPSSEKDESSAIAIESEKEDAPPPPESPAELAEFYVQVGAFQIADNADNFKSRFSADAPSGADELKIVRDDSRNLYLARLGPYLSRAAADAALSLLIKSGIAGFIVAP